MVKFKSKRVYNKSGRSIGILKRGNITLNKGLSYDYYKNKIVFIKERGLYFPLMQDWKQYGKGDKSLKRRKTKR